ncbi:hypothetical protein FRB97_007005 [Tulasnella sp. 331]|nr:hypothetical protein FRB97_007005 [Tulasnella sp. 331]
MPQFTVSDTSDHVGFERYFRRGLRGIRTISNETFDAKSVQLLAVYNPGHYLVPLEAVVTMPEEQVMNVLDNWRPANNFNLSMAGAFELLPVATSTSHPDLNIATGLPKTGAIIALNKTTIPSVIENRVLPVLDHAARLLTFTKDACAVGTDDQGTTTLIPNLSDDQVVNYTRIDSRWPEWRRVALFHNENPNDLTVSASFLWSSSRDRGESAQTIWQLLSGNDTISGSFLFSYMSSEVMSFDMLKEMCMPITLIPGAHLNFWLVAVRPFCQAAGVRHVLLQTDDHAVLVLFNKDHTVATFSHIEPLDLNEAPLASIDVLTPPTPSPSLFTMVAQAMVDCRESVVSGEIAATSTTFPWSAGSVSILRFPLRNLTATLPAAPIAETNLLRFALTCELRKSDIEFKEEIFDASGEVDEAGEDEEMPLAEGGAQTADEPVLAASPDLFETLMMDYQMVFESNEAQQLAAILAMAPVNLENQPPIAMTEEMLESIANPAAMTSVSTIPSMWPPMEQPILDPAYFPIPPCHLGNGAPQFPYPSPASNAPNDFANQLHNPVDVNLYGDLAHHQDQLLTQASGSSHAASLDVYQAHWNGDDNEHLGFDQPSPIDEAMDFQSFINSFEAPVAPGDANNLTSSSLVGGDEEGEMEMGESHGSDNGDIVDTLDNDVSTVNENVDAPEIILTTPSDYVTCIPQLGDPTRLGFDLCGGQRYAEYKSNGMAGQDNLPINDVGTPAPHVPITFQDADVDMVSPTSHVLELVGPVTPAPDGGFMGMALVRELVDAVQDGISPLHPAVYHDEVEQTNAISTKMVVSRSGVLEENATSLTGAKRKRAVTEGGASEAPTQPIIPFDFQPRTPGTHSRTESAPLLGASGVNRRRVIPARSRSYQRMHRTIGRAPTPPSAADENDEDEDGVREPERPVKRLRVGVVRPVASGSGGATTLEAAPAAVSRCSRVRPSRTYKERELEISKQITSSQTSAKKESTASNANGSPRPVTAAKAPANTSRSKKTAARSTSRKVKVEFVEEAMKRETMKSGSVKKRKSTRAGAR